MTLVHIAVLALIQGITEFLPISSHGHLRLVHTVSELRDPGLVIHVAVHVGSLGAVILYFWRDLWPMLDGLVLALRGRWGRGQKLFVTVAVATVPVLIAGYLVQRYADVALYSTEVIAWSTFGFAIVLYLADRFGMTIRRIEHMRVGPALAIGLAQVVALVPGTSRSGITMTMARVLGFERRHAARFSMLMSVPVIIAAGGLQAVEVYESGDLTVGGDALIAAALSFITALIAIAALMRWIERIRFTPFVIYRLLIGGGLLYWLYS